MSTANNKIGLYGFGTVGQGFYEYLQNNNETNLVEKVVIKNTKKSRSVDELEFIDNAAVFIEDKSINTIVELISDADQAYNIIKQALLKGKTVVSANKKALVYHLEELIELEAKHGGKLLYEGAVCGSIPILKLINEFYTYDEITSISGIFNGTSNFILTNLFEKKISYQEALRQAQEAGFAEEDSTSDVGGFDALYKLLILTTHVFGKFILPEKALNIGIENITESDIEFAKNNNLTIKLVARVEKNQGKLWLSVLPEFVDNKSELFYTENELNGVLVASKNLGTQFLKGKGAGKLPIGHVVYTDLKTDSKTHYTYKNIPSGKRLKYETKASIWIYSNQITLLEKYIENVVLLNGSQGYGSIKIADLIKAKELINIHNISVIALNENVKQRLSLQAKRKIEFALG